MKIRTLLGAACLALWAAAAINSPVTASPVTFTVHLSDSTGAPVTGATLAIGGVTLTAGTPATVAGRTLDNTAAVTGASVTYSDYGDGSGDYPVTYDPAAGEAHFTLTATKSGTTIAGGGTIGLNFASDSSVVRSTLTASTANGTAISNVPALDSAAVWGAATKVVTGVAGSVTGSVASVTAPITLAASQAFSNSVAGTVAPTWYTAPPALPGDFLSPGEQANLLAAGTNTPAATVAALLAGTFVTVPGAGTTTGVSESLTWKQEEALVASLGGGNSTATAPVAGGTATVTYYLLGQPKTAGNVVAVSTPSFDAAKAVTGRTVLISQPFPAVL